MKIERPYRLELVGCNWCTTTYTSEQAARHAIPARLQYIRADKWRITKRVGPRKFELIAEGSR